jgi:microcystin degradation protein MlrC
MTSSAHGPIANAGQAGRVKFFFGAMFTETNTFSNIPTNRQSFENCYYCKGEDALRAEGILTVHVQRFAQRAAEIGAEAVIGLCAQAQPSAPVSQGDYEDMRDELLEDLRQCDGVGAVFLMLHGAMVAQHCLDCEGDVLGRVRAMVGPQVPVMAILDPHAHLTDRMLNSADMLAFMKEYPHTDGPECLDTLFRMTQEMLRGTIRPLAAVADCSVVGLWPTQDQPIRGFTDRLHALEGRDGILSVSFIHGFPWGDTPDMGSRILVYTDRDRPAAQRLADQLADEVWEMREASQPRLATIGEALDIVAAADTGPIVLADVADNAGGGAPADSSFILRAVLDRGMTGVAFALFCDPTLVELCRQAGVGGRIQSRVGGKLSAYSGEPVDIDGTVMGLATDAMQLAFGTTPDRMGNTAWILVKGVDIIVSSLRTQCFDPLAFSHLGLDPTQRKALVVKSINHFHAGFGPIARRTIAVGTPGALNMDFAHLPYREVVRPYWPKASQSGRR